MFDKFPASFRTKEKVTKISLTTRDLKDLRVDPCSSLKGIPDLLVCPSFRPPDWSKSEVEIHLPAILNKLEPYLQVCKAKCHYPSLICTVEPYLKGNVYA